MNISTRHIQRALQTAAAPLRESPTLPADALEARDVRIRVAGGTGFPATADSLAYDANQSLLVVRSCLGWNGLAGWEWCPFSGVLTYVRVLETGWDEQWKGQAHWGTWSGAHTTDSLQICNAVPGVSGKPWGNRPSDSGTYNGHGFTFSVRSGIAFVQQTAHKHFNIGIATS